MLLVGWPLRSLFFLVPGAVGLVAYAVVVLAWMSTLNTDERLHIARLRSAVVGRLGR